MEVKVVFVTQIEKKTRRKSVLFLLSIQGFKMDLKRDLSIKAGDEAKTSGRAGIVVTM